MRQYPCTTTWPYMALVGVLFVAAVNAPRMDSELWREKLDIWWSAGRAPRQRAALASSAFAATAASRPAADSPDSASWPVPAPPPVAPSPSEPPPSVRPPVIETAAPAPPLAASPPLAVRPAVSETSVSRAPVGRRPVLESELSDHSEPGERSPTGPKPASPAIAEVDRSNTHAPLAEDIKVSQSGESRPQRPQRPSVDRSIDPAPPAPGARREATAGLEPEVMRPSDTSNSAYPALDQLLAALAQTQDPLLASWCRQVESVLRGLEDGGEPAAWHRPDQVERLNELLAEARPLDARLSHGAERQTLRQLAYALRRRLDLWRQLARLSGATPREPLPVTQLAEALDAAEAIIARHSHADSWRQFLLLDRLRSVANGVRPPVELAREILHRWDSTSLTPQQAQYLGAPELRRLREVLASWSTDTGSIEQFCRAIERFEADPSAAHAEQLTREWRNVVYTYGEQAGDFDWWFEQHYRNANVRLAVSEELVRRIMPALRTYAEQVEDFILGARVQGQNRSWTQLEVDTVADPHRWHLVLRARGQVRSQTASTKGPVTFFNRGNSTFAADKHLLVDADGIFVTQAQVEADASALQLTGLQTQYDAIPLFGWLVRQYALQQHDDQRLLVRREVRDRVASSAGTRIDREVHQRLDRLESRLDRRVIAPLRSVGIEPTLLEMQTTDERLIARGRVAAANQPAGFTARPQALEDSLLSLQVHQSAWNNLVQRLELEGREIRVEELIEQIGRKLDVPITELVDELPEDVVVQFADDRPLEVTMADGYILLTLRFARLCSQDRDWRDFVVKAYYRLDASRLDVELIRDGGIQLICPEIGFRDRLAIRSIFTKVLARHRRLGILHNSLVHSPRLADLVVTQLEVDHGWLGISLGLRPKDSTAARPSSRRQ